jgi:hypothetical protein
MPHPRSKAEWKTLAAENTLSGQALSRRKRRRLNQKNRQAPTNRPPRFPGPAAGTISRNQPAGKVLTLADLKSVMK